jgi:hypothetical protein
VHKIKKLEKLPRTNERSVEPLTTTIIIIIIIITFWQPERRE